MKHTSLIPADHSTQWAFNSEIRLWSQKNQKRHSVIRDLFTAEQKLQRYESQFDTNYGKRATINLNDQYLYASDLESLRMAETEVLKLRAQVQEIYDAR